MLPLCCKQVFGTFKEAALERGLLQDDEEWGRCLTDGAATQMPRQLRSLFAIILMHCLPVKPEDLWEQHKLNLCQDILKRERDTCGDDTLALDVTMEDEGLRDVEHYLRAQGKLLCEFPNMRTPGEATSSDHIPAIFREQLAFGANRSKLERQVREQLETLTPGQRAVYDAVRHHQGVWVCVWLLVWV